MYFQRSLIELIVSIETLEINCFGFLSDYLQQESKDKKGKELDTSGWTLHSKKPSVSLIQTGAKIFSLLSKMSVYLLDILCSWFIKFCIGFCVSVVNFEQIGQQGMLDVAFSPYWVCWSVFKCVAFKHLSNKNFQDRKERPLNKTEGSKEDASYCCLKSSGKLRIISTGWLHFFRKCHIA